MFSVLFNSAASWRDRVALGAWSLAYGDKDVCVCE